MKKAGVGMEPDVLAEAARQIKELKAEIKSNREDYDSWKDGADEKLALANQMLATHVARADAAEYNRDRNAARVDALLFSLVLAQAHAKQAQDALAKLTAEHKRCDRLGLAS